MVDYTTDQSAYEQQEANISELKKDKPRSATPVACKLFTHSYDKCPTQQSSIRKFLKIKGFIGNQRGCQRGRREGRGKGHGAQCRGRSINPGNPGKVIKLELKD